MRDSLFAENREVHYVLSFYASSWQNRDMAELNIRELSSELKAVAKKDLRENEQRIAEHIEYITEWLNKEPHINARMDPQWLVAFLRGCKYSLERTKEKLDLFYTIRSHLPQLFLDRDPEKLKVQQILDMGTYLPLPSAEKPGGPRLVLIRVGVYDPKVCTFQDLLSIFSMALDIMLMEDDRLNVSGQEMIIDLAGNKLEQLTHITPAVLKQAVMCFQNAYPTKVKSLHFINSSPILETAFSILRKFLSQKLKDRMMVHSDIKGLFTCVSQRVLPLDYGGEAPSVGDLTKEWKNKISVYRNWYLEDMQYGVTESQRLGKKITTMDLFGVDGSFRKLDFD